MRLTGPAATLGLAVMLAAPPLRADTCGPAPGLDLVLPVDGSTGVARATQITVRHALADVPSGDAPSVTLAETGGAIVPGASSWDGRQVVLVPDGPLAPEHRYTVTAERAGRAPHTFSFETTREAAPGVAPVLGPAVTVSARYLGGGPEGDDRCGPEGFERYRVHLALPAARGSSGPENILYLVFQTVGRGIEEDPVEVARAVDETGADDVGIDLYLAADGVSGRACFRVVALDVTGASSGTTDEACDRLEEGPFFTSVCSVTGAGAPAFGAPAAPVLSTAIAFVLLRRRGLRG